jgi:uncharacterized protein YndB with AHSA1/START domain
MEKLHYSVQIDAPVHTVWSAMLDDTTYREWTGGFHEGSHYEGSWEKGSTIRFLGPDDDGSLGGMIAKVVENRPYEFVSLEYVGQVAGGVDDTTSDLARRFIGGHEDYSFSEAGGATTLKVELDSDEEFSGMFNDSWPKALAKLKEIAERPS